MHLKWSKSDLITFVFLWKCVGPWKQWNCFWWALCDIRQSITRNVSNHIQEKVNSPSRWWGVSSYRTLLLRKWPSFRRYLQEGWILDPLPGPTSTSQVGSTGRLLAPVLPEPATCFTRCSITSSSCDIRVPLQYPVGKLCLLGKGVHGNYVQLCRKTTFSEFAFANIYTRSVCTTIQVEYDALTQHTQQTTVKSTNQTFEYWPRTISMNVR